MLQIINTFTLKLTKNLVSASQTSAIFSVKRPINYDQGNNVDYKNHKKYVDMLFEKK
jgi:hypothetical protein